MALHPDHLADLQKSWLSDKTINEAGICSVPPNKINKALGFNMPGLSSMYAIPYFDINGKETDFCRYRCFYEELEEDKRNPKYLQRKDSGNHLYFPPGIGATLKDPTIPLYITEGEKKALKAFQEGLPCIALPGLWAWKVKRKEELIPDFDLIEFRKRDIFIVPDNDWLSPNKHGYKKNLEDAVYRLAYKLIERGAND